MHKPIEQVIEAYQERREALKLFESLRRESEMNAAIRAIRNQSVTRSTNPVSQVFNLFRGV